MTSPCAPATFRRIYAIYLESYEGGITGSLLPDQRFVNGTNCSDGESGQGNGKYIAYAEGERKVTMRRLVLKVLTGLGVAVAITWVADYALFRYRVWQNRAPYGSVVVNEYYTIQEKNNRTEYIYKSTDQQTCANSLFPHSGLQVCWYLRKHAEKPTPV